jgi:hypothetical protein
MFQTMDDKSECVGIYCDGDLIFDNSLFPKNLTQTWKYAPYLKHLPDVDYASLYLQGSSVKDVLPEYLLDDWEEVSSRMVAYVRSLRTAKVNLYENCIYDLTPRRFLIDWCEVKNTITKFVLDKVPRPKRYEYLLSVCRMLDDISSRKLNIDKKILQSFALPPMQKQRILKSPPYIQYNQFGTKTGRLTTKPDSFPILTLKRDLRSIISPVNDVFVEMDFNGAEVRVLLGMLGTTQPTGDVHDFHRNSIFGTEVLRSEAKQFFFAWLYGSRSTKLQKFSKKLEQFYKKDKILDLYWDGESVHTPYGKVIQGVDEHHALNYIVQSTTAELTLLQALKINHLLENKAKSSFISAIIHDSIIVDLASEDAHLMPAVKKLMSSTKFGDFRINIEQGKSLGKMRKTNYG